MISEPLCIVRCDGPSSIAVPAKQCEARELVALQLALTPPQVRTFVTSALREWLFVNDRVRCPQCAAIDLHAARQLATKRTAPPEPL